MVQCDWLTVSGCHAMLIPGFGTKDKPANARRARRRFGIKEG